MYICRPDIVLFLSMRCGFYSNSRVPHGIAGDATAERIILLVSFSTPAPNHADALRVMPHETAR